MLEQAVRLGDAAAAGQLAYALAELRIAAGRYTDARLLLAEADRHFEAQDPVGLLPVVAATRVVALRFTGDMEGMRTALTRCREYLGGNAPLAHQQPYTARAEAWAAHGEGHRAQAQRLLLDAADAFASSPVHHARLTYEAFRAGAPAATVAPSLELMRQRSDAPLTSHYATHAAARAADDAHELLVCSDAFERIGALRYAAEAAAQAAACATRDGDRTTARQAAQRRTALAAVDPLGVDFSDPSGSAG